MRLFVNELGRFDYLLHILNNLLRFVKYFQKNFSLGIYAPATEKPQFPEKGTLPKFCLESVGATTMDFILRQFAATCLDIDSIPTSGKGGRTDK